MEERYLANLELVSDTTPEEMATFLLKFNDGNILTFHNLSTGEVDVPVTPPAPRRTPRLVNVTYLTRLCAVSAKDHNANEWCSTL